MKRKLFSTKILILLMLLPIVIVSCSNSNISTSKGGGTKDSRDKRGFALADRISFLKTITEDDIVSMSYELQTHIGQLNYSYCDYYQTYVPSSQEDYHYIYNLLKNCRLFFGDSFGATQSEYLETPISSETTMFTINFKDQKRILFTAYGAFLEYVDSYDRLYTMRDERDRYPRMTIPLPTFSILQGCYYPRLAFDQTKVLDRENNGQYTYIFDVRKLANMVFLPYDGEEISEENEYNEYNKYLFRGKEGAIIFENSKVFKVTVNSPIVSFGVRWFQIINDFSFEDLYLDYSI